jgi:hypothetical protein
MIVLIILRITLLLGLIFEKKEKQSDLPSFTKEEAERYYNTHFKNK